MSASNTDPFPDFPFADECRRPVGADGGQRLDLHVAPRRVSRQRSCADDAAAAGRSAVGKLPSAGDGLGAQPRQQQRGSGVCSDAATASCCCCCVSRTLAGRRACTCGSGAGSSSRCGGSSSCPATVAAAGGPEREFGCYCSFATSGSAPARPLGYSDASKPPCVSRTRSSGGGRAGDAAAAVGSSRRGNCDGRCGGPAEEKKGAARPVSTASLMNTSACAASSSRP